MRHEGAARSLMWELDHEAPLACCAWARAATARLRPLRPNLVLGFPVESLAGAKDREAVLAIVEKCSPTSSRGRNSISPAQLNQFCNQMQVGDLVVVPLKTTSQIAVGEVAGLYDHTAHSHVSRLVKWLTQDLPREAFRQDLLFSFGAFMTAKRRSAPRRSHGEGGRRSRI